MIRCALVMGFGWGQANYDVAALVRKRNQICPFDHILTQAAVLKPLQEAGLSAQLIHEHSAVYVNTVNAAGLGLIKLAEGVLDDNPVEIEVFAHNKQFARAKDATELAKTWLETAPSSPAKLISFLRQITVSGRPPQREMRMNRLSEVLIAWGSDLSGLRRSDLFMLRMPSPQVWTWHPKLYALAETHAERDIDQTAEEFYANLTKLNGELVNATPHK